MKPQPKCHEINLRELRRERRQEQRPLTKLKARLENVLAQRPVSLFAMHPDGRVNAA